MPMSPVAAEESMHVYYDRTVTMDTLAALAPKAQAV
jgi:hypothetical protein